VQFSLFTSSPTRLTLHGHLHSQPIRRQKVSNDSIRPGRVLVEVDVVARTRMNGQLERFRILVNRFGGFFEDARTVPVAKDVIVLTGDMLGGGWLALDNQGSRYWGIEEQQRCNERKHE